MKKNWLYWVVLLANLASSNLNAHEVNLPDPATDLSAVKVVFDAKGNLWRAFVQDGYLQVDKSADLGKTFSQPIKVNTSAQKTSEKAKPDIAIDTNQHIYVAWTQNQTPRFADTIWFARSIDIGNSFEKAYSVNQAVGHHSGEDLASVSQPLMVEQANKMTMVWMQHPGGINTQKNSKKDDKTYADATIHYAISTNQGESFSAPKKRVENSVTCSQMALANKPDGTAALLWRHLFATGDRDYVLAEISQNQIRLPFNRVTFAHNKMDDCTNQNVALANGGAGKYWWGYHLVYSENKLNAQSGAGLFYSRMDGEAWVSSPTKKFGNFANKASQPAILSINNETGSEHVWLVWREMQAERTVMMGMFSEDGGKNWRGAQALASTAGKADYPQLLQYRQQAYLAWNTQKEGFQLIPLKP